MRILITNDDGINAPGLAVLERIARTLSEDVWVVAPETDQSGVAHALSLNDPLRLRDLGQNRFAVRGTPTDCVIMGVREIMRDAPDLVLSGVNRGGNLAEDVTYSGTVAGAIEGTILGIRSVALSQAYGWETRDNPSYEAAEHHAPALVEKLVSMQTPAGTLFNVNFPARAPDAVGGVEITAQGKRNPDSLYIDARTDGRGNPYYWLAFQRTEMDPAKGTDLHAIMNGNISVTPLRLDMTDHEFMRNLSDKLA
ncbi:5'/3'-nucleotidase SurE [Breoghania sp. L-A4]|uniref:5'/3'-nucleotidase SurE n=1 Tax=Breoghania sp. L-A4 TaxID=2304600 RepID=UPI000E359531|nr:5'/3'-nucleotidase SurE [Breoghania sp. L-A4]AXS40536.1 5'/3'-nucleotidase SurE [Breoghania sp. L-A4]